MTSPVACNVTACGKAMHAKESAVSELARILRLPATQAPGTLQMPPAASAVEDGS